LDAYAAFVRGLGVRRERIVPVFTLNYDCLVECAADVNGLALIDGFRGIFEGVFQPANLTDVSGMYELRRNRRVFVPRQGNIVLHKLHGSLGWFSDGSGRISRLRPQQPTPAGHRRLMVPPQHRKAADTGVTPYATLWSEFRAYLANDASRHVNRLVCAGYGFADGHVNALIDAALQREHFTLIVLARVLSDEAFSKYARCRKVLIITEAKSSLYGEPGAGVPNAWSFEWLAQEV
jgi:prepilin-type processing-associated H-X9-DG protein